MDFRFSYKGEEYTRDTFAAAFNLGTDEADEIIYELINRGMAREIQAESAFDTFIKNNSDKAQVHEAAENIRNEEFERVQKARDEYAATVPKYPKVNFQFESKYDAADFVNAVIAKGIRSSNIFASIDGLTVTVTNITEKEYNSLALIYKTRKASDKATRVISKAAKTATGALSYTAENIALPIAKTAIKGAGDLAKTVFKTVRKAGGALISQAASTVRETNHELKNDPTIIVAEDDINTIKSGLKEKLGFSGPNSGISFG